MYDYAVLTTGRQRILTQKGWGSVVRGASQPFPPAVSQPFTRRFAQPHRPPPSPAPGDLSAIVHAAIIDYVTVNGPNHLGQVAAGGAKLFQLLQRYDPGQSVGEVHSRGTLWTTKPVMRPLFDQLSIVSTQ